tara:strand:+ start:18 stop:1157 length:1140 start_codon:yes stop_codon:yes gene_type:complete
MRLLDRYLLRELVVPLFYCMAGFQVFWTAFDLFSRMRDLQNRGLSGADIGRYYLYQTPELLATVLPVALLLAMLYSLTNHARNNELVAMRAAGVSRLRLCSPYLAVGLVLGTGLFAMAEFVIPRTNAKAANLLLAISSQGNPEAWKHDLNVRLPKEHQFIHAERFNVETYRLDKPTVEFRTPDGAHHELLPRQKLESRAEWKNGQWVFYNMEWKRTLPGEQVPPVNLPPLEQTNVTQLSITPAQLITAQKITSLSKEMAAKRLHLSLREIREFRRLNPNLRATQPEMHAKLSTQYHGRLAQPWACVVVVLVALPFGGVTARRNTFVGVAASVVLCFLYFILLRVGLGMGTGAVLPPVIAAWLPNAVFGLAGIIMTWRMP